MPIKNSKISTKITQNRLKTSRESIKSAPSSNTATNPKTHHNKESTITIVCSNTHTSIKLTYFSLSKPWIIHNNFFKPSNSFNSSSWQLAVASDFSLSFANLSSSLFLPCASFSQIANLKCCHSVHPISYQLLDFSLSCELDV